MDAAPPDANPPPHRRRPRYPGKNPRKFHEKYKELRADQYPETVEKVLASGKTPAGTHRSILLPEILGVLAPQPVNLRSIALLGYGGHAEAILRRIAGPGAHLLALDVDPIEGPRTAARLLAAGFGPDLFSPGSDATSPDWPHCWRNAAVRKARTSSWRTWAFLPCSSTCPNAVSR